MVLPFLQEAPHHEAEERGRGRIKNWRTWATAANGIDFRQAATAGVINGTRKIKETLEHIAAARYRALSLLATVCNRSTR
jgi:hypothetical protein